METAISKKPDTGSTQVYKGDALSAVRPRQAVTKHQHDVPSDLEDIVHRCLAKDPADRFLDAESLELALATCEGASQWTSQQAAAWWHSQNGLYGQPDRATDYSSVCVP